jgi:multiple sugar transport system substrate-binding protein
MLDNPDIQQIAEAGALAPLGDFGLNADGYAPGPVSAATYDGQLYGLQPGANTLAIFYNKDVLAKAGVQPPKTWAELKTAAKKLTSGKQYGFAFNATADYEGAWQFLPPMWTNGGDETDLKSPQVAEALQLWKDLVDDGSVSKSAVNWKQSDVNDQFIAGKAAMMENGPWQIPALTKAKMNFGVVPFPVNTPDQKSVAPLGGEAWTVPETGNDAKKAKAAELVKCMNTDENQMLRAKQGGLVPTKLALAAEFKKEVPSMAGFTDAVASARARTGKLGAKWPDTAKVIYTGMQLVLTGQAPPADAMAKAGAS